MERKRDYSPIQPISFLSIAVFVSIFPNLCVDLFRVRYVLFTMISKDRNQGPMFIAMLSFPKQYWYMRLI